MNEIGNAWITGDFRHLPCLPETWAGLKYFRHLVGVRWGKDQETNEANIMEKARDGAPSNKARKTGATKQECEL